MGRAIAARLLQRFSLPWGAGSAAAPHVSASILIFSKHQEWAVFTAGCVDAGQLPEAYQAFGPLVDTLPISFHFSSCLLAFVWHKPPSASAEFANQRRLQASPELNAAGLSHGGSTAQSKRAQGQHPPPAGWVPDRGRYKPSICQELPSRAGASFFLSLPDIGTAAHPPSQARLAPMQAFGSRFFLAWPHRGRQHQIGPGQPGRPCAQWLAPLLRLVVAIAAEHQIQARPARVQPLHQGPPSPPGWPRQGRRAKCAAAACEQSWASSMRWCGATRSALPA